MFVSALRRLGFVLALFTSFVWSACSDESSPTSPPIDRVEPSTRAVVERSLDVARPGEPLVVAVGASGNVDLLGMQGSVRFDPRDLQFVGQLLDPDDLTFVDDAHADRGRVGFAALRTPSANRLDVGLLPGTGERPVRLAYLVFKSLRGGPIGPLELEDVAVLDEARERVQLLEFERAIRTSVDLPPATGAVRLDLDGWSERLALTQGNVNAVHAVNVADTPGDLVVARIPGESRVFGDGDNNGRIDLRDAIYALAIATGRIRCVEDADDTRDCVAANVRPANLPGLGEPDDPCPPGLDQCGGSDRTVNIADAFSIAAAALGAPISIVGKDMDGRCGRLRCPPEPPIDPTDLPSVIVGTLVLDRGEVYRINGAVQVGEELGEAGELVIPAGTWLVSPDGSRLVVTRNGRIDARGTSTAPVVFTCEDTGSGVGPGCWQGVFLAGNATVADPDPDLGPAPFIPGRNPGGGGQLSLDGVVFGGLNDEDDSGTLRYVVIEYAGGGDEAGALTLGACGSATVVSHVQVHASGGDGIVTVGGACDVDHLLVTAPAADHWEAAHGYTGASQSLVLQSGENLTSGAGLRLRGHGTAPSFANVTFVGGGPGNPQNSFLWMEGGATAVVENALSIEAETAVVVQDESCKLLPQAGGSISVTTSVFLGEGTAGASADCDVVFQEYLAQSTIEVRGYEDDVIDPFGGVVPCFRPRGSGVAARFEPAIPGGAFDAAAYFGGVRPEGRGGAIPWHSGWAFGWRNASTP